jgi:hypothetical protein
MRIVVSVAIAACLLVSRAEAQAPPVNAALRYWMAFAVMKDPPDGKFGVTAEQVDQIAGGAPAWDEATLGRLVEENREALAIMQRATALQSCDWGLEYELGPRTPIAHLAKGRVLGRLNGLSAARLAARGEWNQAADAWIAGVRFSQHVAQGGSLISVLSAKNILKASLSGLVATLNQPSLDGLHRSQIGLLVRALPEAGFDWDAAMAREEQALSIALNVNSRHPAVLARMPNAAMVNLQREETRADRQRALAAVSRP